MVKKNLAVAVVDDGTLDDRGRDDVLDLLRYHNSFAEELTHGLEEVLQILGHALLADGFPSLLQEYHLADALQSSHLVDEGLHNDDGNYREEYLIILDIIQLEDDKPLVEQVQLLVGVQ